MNKRALDITKKELIQVHTCKDKYIKLILYAELIFVKR